MKLTELSQYLSDEAKSDKEFLDLLDLALRFPDSAVTSLERAIQGKDVEGVADVVNKLYSKYSKTSCASFTLKELRTTPDPAIEFILSAALGQGQDASRIMVETHREVMGAENILGALLECYIATLLTTKGWIRCDAILQAVDFARPGPHPTFLQVKNRDNSENSSSSAIRKGTTIVKWHRISSKTKKTHWEKLPENEKGVLTEQGFYKYIESRLSQN